MDPYDNMHNMSPEQVFFHTEDKTFWERKKKHFKRQRKEIKRDMLIDFISKHKDLPRYEEEVRNGRNFFCF